MMSETSFMGVHIVIVGNPVHGFEFYGPFKTGLEASDWASGNKELDADWWVAPLHKGE